MDLTVQYSNQHLQSKSYSLTSRTAASHFSSTIALCTLVSQCGTHKSAFVIKAVLADRPTAPDARNKQIVLEGPYISEPLGVAASETRSPLRVQKNKRVENEMGMRDTELESNWMHRIWVATGSAAMLGMMMKAVEAADSAEAKLGMLAAVAGAYIVADLATGVYHWAIDNYGDAHTPVFGPQIDAFQGHHKRPWTITKRQFANNIHALARPATFALAPFLLMPSNAYADSFLGVFLACVVYSQQFHAWAHTKKGELPELVCKLQDAGLLVSRKMHGVHHRPPFDVNYCIVSGLWNPLLDRTRFFTRLEKLIFATYHVRPRSWAETSLDWHQEGSYFSDGTDVDDTSTR